MSRNYTTAGATLALFLSATGLAAQSNASSNLMTYGDVPGRAATATMWNTVNPNKPAIFVPSLLNTTSQYLVTQTGDPNDLLSVGIDLAGAGTYFQTATNASGTASVNFTLPPTAPVGLTVYWQSFTSPGGGGATQYQDFSFKRVMTLNNANAWQAPNPRNLPTAPANLAWVITKTGPQGRATELFACGGGPALLTDELTPYNTFNTSWYYSAADDSVRVVAAMNTSRAFHTLTLLPNGKLLAVGGVTFGGQKANGDYFTRVLNDAELYDPVANTWTVMPLMNRYRAGHTATLLNNGLVLVAGGTEGNSAHELLDFTDLLGTETASMERFDYTNNTWVATNTPSMTQPKAGHAAVKLADGKVALLGGITFTTILGVPLPDFSNAVTVYDPVANSTATGGTLGAKRALFATAVLPNGKIACIGGAGGDVLNPGPIKQSNLYDPVAKNSSAMADLPQDSAFCVARNDPDNPEMIWVVGGAKGTVDDPDPIDALYRYDMTGGTSSIATFASMPVTRGGGIVEVLEDKTIYAAGGESNAAGLPEIGTNRADSYSRP